MRIGVPKEIKIQEHRVAATPELVRTLVAAGHEVSLESRAGQSIGFTDDLYLAAGAKVVDTAKDVYQCELVFKVKEPQPSEFAFLRKGQILFCYLHLAAEPVLAKALVASECIAIAFDTVTDRAGRLPLLIPMSEVAGRIAVQVGATALQMNYGGRGVLLGGVAGLSPSKVVVIGGGVAGTEAARMALGLGAQVIVIDKSLARLRELDSLFQGRLMTRFCSEQAIMESLIGADLVIGAVLNPGKKAPKLVKRPMLANMPQGAVIVDIAIDQGGCFETSRPTTHDNPTFVVDGITHYCVTNMPGACAKTATQALANATGEYVLALASKGYQKALMEDASLRAGLNVCGGKVTNRSVADDLGYTYVAPDEFLLAVGGRP